jgi:ABC-2 type transport system permease protein
MGATLNDVLPELRCLWIQAAAYLGAACMVYGHQLRESHRHAHGRLDYLRKKRAVRQLLNKRKER